MSKTVLEAMDKPSEADSAGTAPQRGTLAQDLAHFVRGVCMGGADVVPGVSGGTVALILGIYRRLVTAISHVDLTLLDQLRTGQFSRAASHLDLRFLVVLAAGLAVGFGITTLVINDLLTSPQTRPFTLAVFFGMILASAVLVARLVRFKSVQGAVVAVGLGLAGAGFAGWLALLENSAQQPSLPYLFFCGSVAICAMILPGISGAMILLILGVYLYLTEIPHLLLHGEHVGRCLTEIVVFGAGCAISLVAFSKFLRWLLEKHQPPTMALLCGFMFGALVKLWPFQRDLTPDQLEFKHKTLIPQWPESWGGPTWAVFATILVAAAVVFLVDRFARSRPPAPATGDGD